MPGNYPNIGFNEKGICDYCTGKKYFGLTANPEIRSVMKNPEKLIKDFHETVKDCRGSGEYDCLVAVSGGKDSSYLAYLLKETYHLHILTVTVDTGLLGDVAKENIDHLVNRLAIDHFYITPRPDFFKKIYQYYIQHPKLKKENDEEIGYINTVCPKCCKAIDSLILKEAVKRNIPVIFLGYTSEEIEDYCHFYEIPREEIAEKSWLPKELNTSFFNEEDRSYFWNPFTEKVLRYPRIIYPFHVTDYLTRNETIKRCKELSLVKKPHPRSTDCILKPLLMYLDLKTLGYNSYIQNVSYNIREKKTSLSRREWLLLLTIGDWLGKSGLYKKRDMNNALEYLNIGLKDLLK
jgi:hypothetical protein